MLTLLQWITAHLFADFVLQTRKLVQQKKERKAGSWFLYVHCLIQAGLVYLFSPDKSIWIIPVIIFVTHYLIDLWKLYQKDSAITFIADQLLHIIVLIFVWVIWYGSVGWTDIFSQLLNDYNAWLIAIAYLVTVFPLAYIIGLATQRWRKDIEQDTEGSETSLSEAGKWIGVFERILVLTFVINNHFEGIGFLIAAKSILRLNEIKNRSLMRKEAEYILIGTLMSFAASIIIGIIILLLMK
jgi:hypothetical protein